MTYVTKDTFALSFCFNKDKDAFEKTLKDAIACINMRVFYTRKIRLSTLIFAKTGKVRRSRSRFSR